MQTCVYFDSKGLKICQQAFGFECVLLWLCKLAGKWYLMYMRISWPWPFNSWMSTTADGEYVIDIVIAVNAKTRNDQKPCKITYNHLQKSKNILFLSLWCISVSIFAPLWLISISLCARQKCCFLFPQVSIQLYSAKNEEFSCHAFLIHGPQHANLWNFPNCLYWNLIAVQ